MRPHSSWVSRNLNLKPSIRRVALPVKGYFAIFNCDIWVFYLPLWLQIRLQIACTFMEWNPLRLATSFLFSCGAWILMQVPSTQPITPGNPPLVKNTVFVLKYLLFGRWPLEEVSLFLCKGKWNLADYMGHRWLWVAQSISNNLKKASGGEKAQRYKDLHSCRVYHARNRNHFLVFLFSTDD